MSIGFSIYHFLQNVCLYWQLREIHSETTFYKRIKFKEATMNEKKGDN